MKTNENYKNNVYELRKEICKTQQEIEVTTSPYRKKDLHRRLHKLHKELAIYRRYHGAERATK